jgi:hypothetical protein
VAIQVIGGIKRRVFVSFDTDRDRPMRDFFISQGRRDDSTWSVTRWSEEFDAEDPSWISDATHHIKQAEVFVLLLGPTSFQSPGVLKEIIIAKILNKQIYQIIPPGKGTPNVIPNVGRVLKWEWAAVKRAIATMPPKWQTGKTVYA